MQSKLKPMDINNTFTTLQPLTTSIESFVGVVQMLVGGLFGLYLIMAIMRYYEARQMRKLMKDIKTELTKLRESLKK